MVVKKVLGLCAEGCSAKAIADWKLFDQSLSLAYSTEGTNTKEVYSWFAPEVLNLKTAPIWIHLWHVPLEFYSQQRLSYLASVLGKPLYTDKATTLRQHLEFAKICVEVYANFSLLSYVLVDLGDDDVIVVGVELVWAPPKCSHCSIFGNLEDKCARSIVVDDSAQLNSSTRIVELETIISCNLVDFIKVCAQLVERVLDEVSVVVVGICGNVVDEVIVGVVGNCVNVVDRSIAGNLVSSTGVAISKIVITFADVVSAQVDDNLLVGDGFGSCFGKDIVGSMGDAMLSPNKFDALATAPVEQEGVPLSPRKAAGGVAELLNPLKTKHRGQVHGQGPAQKKKKEHGLQATRVALSLPACEDQNQFGELIPMLLGVDKWFTYWI
ncbi:hypothetical protein V6N11_019311 [Hibiscus sabdariffa]|uniref:DUF4283 domain-containing protein n=1 Tax=Hibiscus sabdariffa TaxID=183260 RepID=A0ABR2R2K4_9ROSI